MGRMIAFIPARSGSKSIPKKNIKNFNGKPLIHWVINAALNCDLIDHVYVSTDGDEIAEKVKLISNKKLSVVKRSDKTSTDTASTESAMFEFAKDHEFDNIILIQPTSPLLNNIDLESAINKYNIYNADSLLSVVRQKRFIWKESKNYIKPVNYDPQSRPLRQDFEGFYIENGAFYITSRKALYDSNSRISGNVIFYEMHENTYFEIDDPSDWIIAESLHKYNN